MKFFSIFFYTPPLYAACENGNVEIVQLLLLQNGIDVNCKKVLIILVFNEIFNHFCQCSFIYIYIY